MNKIIKIPFALQKKRLMSTIETLCMTYMLLVGSSSCSQKIEDIEKIPFAEYSLDGENPPNKAYLLYPYWVVDEDNMSYKSFGCSIFTDSSADYLNKVLLINSNEELGKYIVCTDVAIDFSKHSLLLARVNTSPNPGYLVNTTLYKKGGFYILNIEVNYFEISGLPGLTVAILTPKIKNETTIALKIDEIKN